MSNVLHIFCTNYELVLRLYFTFLENQYCKNVQKQTFKIVRKVELRDML